MKIGIMCHSGLGGSVRIATELAAELTRRSHRVHLFTQTKPFNHAALSSAVVLHLSALDSGENGLPGRLRFDWSAEEFSGFLASLLETISLEELDILHFHYALPFVFLAAEVKARLGRQAPLLIGTLHGSDVSLYGRDADIGPRMAERLAQIDALTTVSRRHARLAAELFGLPHCPEVIPNFVNLAKFKPRGPAVPDLDEIATGGNGRSRTKRKVRIIHASNFRPIKNLKGVIQIFRGIRERLEAELWLVGDGPDMNLARSLVKLNRIEGEVRYWGIRPDIETILALADLLLIASHEESFCLTALEAMACGVPVLAPAVGGLPEVVVQGETGLLFSPADLDQAITQAVELLSDPVRYQRMSIKAARHAQRFGHQRVVSLYEDLYQALLRRDAAK